MMNEAQKAMHLEIMKTQFFIYEIALYLDTHPNSIVAIQQHTMLVNKLRTMVSKYEKLYGPLNIYGISDPNCWNYIDSPWPWEIEY